MCELFDVRYVELYDDSRSAAIVAYEIDATGAHIGVTDILGNPHLDPSQLGRDTYAFFAAHGPLYLCTSCAYYCASLDDIKVHVGDDAA